MWEAIKRTLGFPTEPEKAARTAFRQRYPNQIFRTRLAADEGSRFIVGVFYFWSGRPPKYRFYSVDKATMAAEELQDDSAYRPKNWR